MLRVAEGLGLDCFHLIQADPGGATSLQAAVSTDALAAILAPAERAGVVITRIA
jgi:hypothetical protein